MPSNERFALRAQIALLETGKSLDLFSMMITLATVGGLLAIALGVTLAASGSLAILLLVSLAAGTLEKYYALRVAYDAAIFCALNEEQAAIGDLDAVLQHQFGQIPRPDYDLASRCGGARLLLGRQGGCFLVQLLFLLGAIGLGIRFSC